MHPARRIAAGALLATATLVALGATQKLERLRALPVSSWPYYAFFAVSVVLAFLAGRTARSAPVAEPPGESPARPELACRPLVSLAAAAVAVILLFRTWQLDQLAAPPLSIYLWWLAAIGATLAAFPGVRLPERQKTSLWPVALLAVALLAAAGARLTNLDTAPAVYSGDEANQALDGRSLLEGVSRENPFGTGWYSTMRLGMLLAGAGPRFGSDPVVGARLPYAVAGTVSVAAAAAAGAAVSGSWGAAAGAALLAFAPHHVHFSRLSSVMILDALFVPLLVFFLVTLRRTGSPRIAALTGVAAGLSLYGYSGGRVAVLVFLIAIPVVVLGSEPAKGRRGLLLAALLLGFVAAAGPNLHFAADHFGDWNGRFNQVSVFSADWWNAARARWGSPPEIVAGQFNLGAIGLLSVPDPTPWFTGHPMIGPPLLVSLAIAGLGWIVGRRQIFPAVLLGLLFAGNLAGVVLTSGAPTPQRASSLLPVLAILGSAAVAGLLGLLPDPPAAKGHWRSLAGGLFVAAYLLETAARQPFGPDAAPAYGGPNTAFGQSAAVFLQAPRWRMEPVFLHGSPYLSADLSLFPFFLGDRKITDLDPARVEARELPPGVHIFAPQYAALAQQVRKELGVRGLALPHPAYPLVNIGYVVRVPVDSPATNR